MTDLINIMPLQPSYELESTKQPKTNSGTELKDLEKERYFALTPAQNSTDEVILCLTNGICSINIFSRTDGINMLERKSLDSFEAKEQTLYRKSLQVEELKSQESEKNRRSY